MESKYRSFFHHISEDDSVCILWGFWYKTNVKVDGVKQAGAPTTVVLEAGAHKITKSESTTVALIKLVPVTE